jgi:tetratricopeptide (TPR) repeat protein
MVSCRNLVPLLVFSGSYVGSCVAQREPPDLERRDAPSILLYQISVATEPAKKLAFLEQFASEFPTDRSIGWIYDRMYTIFVESNQRDRAMDIAEKLLAIDPEDVELAYSSLKFAEEKKDRALIAKWSQITTAAVKRVMATPRDTENGKRQLELARQVRDYLEYLAYAEILQTTSRPAKLQLMEQFLESCANSQYIPAVERVYLAYWREADPTKALAVAEQMIQKNQANEDALILVAEHYAQRDKDPEKVLTYAGKAIALMDHNTSPDGIPDAEWLKKKAALTGRANWLIGTIAMEQGRFGQADKSIRAALPYLKSDARLVSTALFYLGWANYKIGHVADAIRFTEDCTRVKGPFQNQAIKNLAVIRSENPRR